MLTTEERAEIERELGVVPVPRAACVEALKAVQRHRGWVPDEALAEVAALLGMDVTELESVATYYNLIFRRPVGRHVILLCDSVSCWILGCDRIGAALGARLGLRPGETTADGRFTLLPMACLGACDRAPALMIDEDLHTELEPEGIDRILEGYP